MSIGDRFKEWFGGKGKTVEAPTPQPVEISGEPEPQGMLGEQLQRAHQRKQTSDAEQARLAREQMFIDLHNAVKSFNIALPEAITKNTSGKVTLDFPIHQYSYQYDLYPITQEEIDNTPSVIELKKQLANEELNVSIKRTSKEESVGDPESSIPASYIAYYFEFTVTPLQKEIGMQGRVTQGYSVDIPEYRLTYGNDNGHEK